VRLREILKIPISKFPVSHSVALARILVRLLVAHGFAYEWEALRVVIIPLLFCAPASAHAARVSLPTRPTALLVHLVRASPCHHARAYLRPQCSVRHAHVLGWCGVGWVDDQTTSGSEGSAPQAVGPRGARGTTPETCSTPPPPPAQLRAGTFRA
jgi:hypothetical protein